MDNKMKGLFKGLRYISQIFENPKEPQMNIGYPTDVKHVAHIGWDGPSPPAATASGPTWMNEFQSGTEENPQDTGSSHRQFPDVSSARGATLEKPPSRPPRHKSSFGDSESANQDREGSTRQPQRRYSSSSSASASSPTRDPMEGSRRKSRSASASRSPESQQPDVPAVPKQNRRRKVKGSSGSSSSAHGGGSRRSSRSRDTESAPELAGDEEVRIGAVRSQKLTARDEDSF